MAAVPRFVSALVLGRQQIHLLVMLTGLILLQLSFKIEDGDPGKPIYWVVSFLVVPVCFVIVNIYRDRKAR